MIKLLNPSIFLILLVLLFSCGDDDDSSLNQTDVTIDLSTDFTGFVLITNQDKDILYFEQGSVIGTINFSKEEGEIIDFTYGNLNRDRFFNIKTYRNIGANFEMKSKYSASDILAKPPEIFADRTLEINNLNGEVIAAPYRNVEIENGKIRLSNFMSDQSHLVTVFDENCECHKSIKIDPEDWSQQSDTVYFHAIDIVDFQESVEHRIQLSHSLDNWIVNASVKIEDNREVTLLHWTNYKQNQEGFEISIFTTPGLSFETLSLNVRTSSPYEDIKYNRVDLVDFPNEINFMEMETAFENISPTSYTLSNDEPYEMAEVFYRYHVDNYISRWKIFQVREETLDYKLPCLPEELMIGKEAFLEAISQPSAIAVEYFQLERPIEASGFSYNRDEILNCEYFSSSVNSESF